MPEGEGNAAAMVAEQPVQIWLTKGWKRATSMAAAARMAASPAPRAIHGFPRGARNGAGLRLIVGSLIATGNYCEGAPNCQDQGAPKLMLLWFVKRPGQVQAWRR